MIDEYDDRNNMVLGISEICISVLNLLMATVFRWGILWCPYQKIQRSALIKVIYGILMAEEVGFEPTVGVNLRRFSRPVHSTTLPLLRQKIEYWVSEMLSRG